MQHQLAYERVNIASLKFDPRNARKHDDRNIKAIMDSLSKFGQQKAIVVGEDNIVIAGNGTLEAAKRLGWDTIDVRRSGLKSDEATAYAIADNRSAELAEWDDSVLGDILSELKESGWELDDLGFNDDDLEKYIKQEGTEGLTDEDDVPEVAQNEFGVKRGDIWQLGNHRVMCGDSTDKATVEKLMNGKNADMVFTDPPYGMNLDCDFSDMPSAKGTTSKKYKNVIGDHEDFSPSLITTIFENFSYAREIFLWGADYYADILPDRNNGSWVVWDKRSDGGMDKLFGSSFELCWSRTKHKRDLARIVWAGYFGMGADDTKTRVHPTQKPAKLAQWFFERWGKDNDVIVDLFLGSGSTLIACEKTGRKCYGMELDEHYCSVIIKRWQDFTGKKAERIVEGA